LFTSGSKGTPKGTVHTHGSALRAVRAGLSARLIGADDRLYIPMPWFWAGGLSGGLLTALVTGATLVMETDPTPSSTLKCLYELDVTVFRGWPDQAARLAEQPEFDLQRLTGLRACSLGALLPPNLRGAPGARANLFGMSETFGPYAGWPLDADLPAGKEGSCGQPFRGVEVKIVDSESHQELPPGSSGEIFVRGETLMRGIWGQERHTVFEPDGYYRTGDLGRLDADGFLWYDGRADDMFKVKGATVFPIEVERELRTLPGVSHAWVMDVHENGTSQVGAVVIGNDLQVAVLDAEARRRLSSFKVPTRWLVVPDESQIPRLASDKVDMHQLRQLLIATGSAHQRSAPNDAPAGGSRGQ